MEKVMEGGAENPGGIWKEQALELHRHPPPQIPISPLVKWAHLFFNRPLKSSSPASSGFPSPLQPLRGDMSLTESHPGVPTPCLP